MKVLFVHHGRSFLPELPAYRECLEEAGHGTDVSMEPMSAALCSRYDLIFRFGGVLREIPGSTTPEVHEYHSASTTRLPRLKNFIKSVVAKRPAGRVFLSPFVRRQYFFNDNAPEIYRDMGASRVFIDCWNPDSRKQYDLTYCGSIAGRPTVVAALCRLGRLGLRVSIAGRATAAQAQTLLEAPNPFFAGELEASPAPSFLADDRAGQNLSPNLYPFREQASTNVID